MVLKRERNSVGDSDNSKISPLRDRATAMSVIHMLDERLIFIGGVFALAGFVKGAIGLGLPTISMGLLAVVMSPIEAAAILILPSFVTSCPATKTASLRVFSRVFAVFCCIFVHVFRWRFGGRFSAFHPTICVLGPG